MNLIRLTVAAAWATAGLCGCSAKTAYFHGQPLEQVQGAYEHIFHPPPPPPPPRTESAGSSRRGWLGRLFEFDLNLSDLAAKLDSMERSSRLLGFWFTSSERRWKGNRYESSNVWWWLIFPLKVNSEKATVQQTESGTELRIEIYPRDDALLERRFQQVRENLDIKEPP